MLVASAGLGLSLVWINVGAITLIQRRVPSALVGRVDAALEFAITVPQAVSIAAGAALIAIVSYRVLSLAMAVVIAFSAAYLASRREPEPGQTTATAASPADSMPREPAGTL